ncbi:hypothetical protein GGI16_007165, partial [Coemansia sp. S142-1]
MSNNKQKSRGDSSSNNSEQVTSTPSSPKQPTSRSPSPSTHSLGSMAPDSPMGLGECDPNILKSFRPIETNMSYD